MKILSRKLILSLAAVTALAACGDNNGKGTPPAPIDKAKAQPIVSNGPLSLDSGEVQDADVAQVESQLPPISALDTFGGQLLAGYLQGTLSGEEVVKQTFDDDDYVMSNMAEMSMAIAQLKKEGNYTEENRDKVVVLEGALTQYLNEKIEHNKTLANVIEYGTAVGLGVVGGVYSNEVINGLRYIGNSRLVQAPISAVRAVYVGAKGQASKLGSFVASQGTKIRDSKSVAATVNKSSELARRASAYIATRGGRLQGKEAVLRGIARVYGSPQLARGVRVTDIPDEEIGAVKRMVFYKTGINGLRIHQTKGADFFVVRQIKKGGEFEYFYVQGTGVKALTRNGEELLVPPQTLTRMTASRLKDYGNRSVNFVTTAGKRIKTSVTNSRAYQYATTNPQARRAIQGTAVGGTIGGLTLLALRPIDIQYLTLEDYVKDLESEGVHIEDFLDNQRANAQLAAGVN